MNERTPEPTASSALPLAAKPVIQKIRDLISVGRATEALARVAGLDKFERDGPTGFRMTKAVLLIDIANILDDLDLAKKGISLIRDVDVATLPESARAMHSYNLGNGYGAVYHAKKIRSGVGRALDEDFNRARKCY